MLVKLMSPLMYNVHYSVMFWFYHCQPALSDFRACVRNIQYKRFDNVKSGAQTLIFFYFMFESYSF